MSGFHWCSHTITHIIHIATKAIPSKTIIVLQQRRGAAAQNAHHPRCWPRAQHAPTVTNCAPHQRSRAGAAGRGGAETKRRRGGGGRGRGYIAHSLRVLPADSLRHIAAARHRARKRTQHDVDERAADDRRWNATHRRRCAAPPPQRSIRGAVSAFQKWISSSSRNSEIPGIRREQGDARLGLGDGLLPGRRARCHHLARHHRERGRELLPVCARPACFDLRWTW